MNELWILIMSALISFFVGILSSFLGEYIWHKKITYKKRFKWKIKTKLETSFLIRPISKEEIRKKEIKGDEIKVIKSFHDHYKFFQELIVEYGYENKKISSACQDYLDEYLRPFLVYWENFVEQDELTKSEKEKFLEEVLTLQSKSNAFYQNSLN